MQPYWQVRADDPYDRAFVSRTVVNHSTVSWTTLGTLGTLDGPSGTVVDPRGLVWVRDRRWAIDLWIGADDRWHLPSSDTGVRQSSPGPGVVETRIRVPGGDALVTVWAVTTPTAAPWRDPVVVEVANESKLPFAVAVALRPYIPKGPGGIHSIERRGTVVSVDGEAAVAFAKPPGRAVLVEGEAADVLFGGDAPTLDEAPSSVRSTDGLASAAFVFPLAHTASLRFLVADGSSVRRRRVAAPPDLDALPPPDAVVRGWQSHLARGARASLPDDRVAALLESSLATLLASKAPVDECAPVALALAAWGQVDAATDRLGAYWRDPDPATARAALAATVAVGAGRPDWASQVASAAERLAIAGDAAAVRDAAVVLDRGGEPEAAAQARAAAEATVANRPDAAAPASAGPVVAAPGHGLGVAATAETAIDDLAAGDERALDRLAWLVEVASPTGAWPDEVHPGTGMGCGSDGHSVTAVAAFARAVAALLVSVDGGVATILPVLPPAWLGQPVEVHDLPVGDGRLSFAVRWHGRRPALLWSFEGATMRVRCPSLLPGWSSGDERGEALGPEAPEPVTDALPEPDGTAVSLRLGPRGPDPIAPEGSFG